MAWNVVEKLVEQAGEHATVIGKFWVTSFLVFRLLLVSSIASNTWGGSQSDFVCNTQSPGCKNVCFNEYSPLAVNRYWFLNILCVALPSIIFIIYTAHKMAKVKQVVDAREKKQLEEKEARKKKRKEKFEEKKKKIVESGGRVEDIEGLNEDSDDENAKSKEDNLKASKLSSDTPSKLFLAYFFVVLITTLIDIGFIVGQYYIYTFHFVMPELWQCRHWPCPDIVDCFVSRPKEKTIMICAYYACTCVMVVLNVFELFHISGNFAKAWKERGDDITKHADEGPSFNYMGGYSQWTTGADYLMARPHGYPEAAGMPTIYHPAAVRGHRPGMPAGRRNRNRRY